jgi:integrase
MALLHGLSVEEVAGLRWADVDLDQDQIRLGGRRARTVPLAPRLREYLTALPPQGRSGELALWVGEEGGHAEPAELDAMVETAAYDAGLTRPAEITSRALRHTYLLFLVRQGARLRDLGRVAGHIPPTELVTYGKLCPPGQGLPLEQVELIYPSLKQPA